MAPEDSLARLRKAVIDRVERGEATVVQACREAGMSRSRFYELRHRYRLYGEAGLRPKPRPAERPDRRLAAPLVDAILAYAVEHPTAGERSIADALALPRYGGWRVSHTGVGNVLRRAGLSRRAARLAAAESLAAAEGGPLTERTLRQIRAIERARTTHIGSDVVGEQLFLDTLYVGNLKGVGKVWQYSAVDGACSFGFAAVRAGPKTAAQMADFLEAMASCRSTRRPGSSSGRSSPTGARSSGGPSGSAAEPSGSAIGSSRPARPISTPSSSASRGRSSTSTTGSPSGTASMRAPLTSTPTSRPGSGSTTSSGRTAVTGRRAVGRPRSSTRRGPISWLRKDGISMTTLRSLSGRNAGRTV
ncbi:MAG: hypothetical protein KatS3mg065_0903 [Chloroflexota bacterium]|nr:MAG: hypothetical protein KatS3mg065_0903 [Chloroflexota bacterium]